MIQVYYNNNSSLKTRPKLLLVYDKLSGSKQLRWGLNSFLNSSFFSFFTHAWWEPSINHVDRFLVFLPPPFFPFLIFLLKSLRICSKIVIWLPPPLQLYSWFMNAPLVVCFHYITIGKYFNYYLLQYIILHIHFSVAYLFPAKNLNFQIEFSDF